MCQTLPKPNSICNSERLCDTGVSVVCSLWLSTRQGQSDLFTVHSLCLKAVSGRVILWQKSYLGQPNSITSKIKWSYKSQRGFSITTDWTQNEPKGNCRAGLLVVSSKQRAAEAVCCMSSIIIFNPAHVLQYVSAGIIKVLLMSSRRRHHDVQIGEVLQHSHGSDR